MHPAHKLSTSPKSGAQKQGVAKAAFLEGLDSFEISDLCQRLVIGNLAFALQSDADLHQAGVTGLLCVHDDSTCPSLHSELPSLHLPMSDERLVSFTFFSQWVSSCLDAIEDLSNQAGPEARVLVYCGKGVNRSVAAVVGALVLNSQLSFEEALSCVEAAKERTLAVVARSPPSSPRASPLSAFPNNPTPILSAPPPLLASPPLSPPRSSPLSSPPLSPSYSIIPPLPPPVYWDTLTNKSFRDYLKLLALERAAGRREQRDFESTAEEEDDGPCRLETMSESDLEDAVTPRTDVLEEDGFVLLRC